MIDTPFYCVLNKKYLFGMLLMLTVMMLAIALVSSRYNNRLLYADLQKYYEKRDKLQDSWSQLLLEHGTWASDLRVEQVAYEELGMVQPKKVQVINP